MEDQEKRHHRWKIVHDLPDALRSREIFRGVHPAESPDRIRTLGSATHFLGDHDYRRSRVFHYFESAGAARNSFPAMTLVELFSKDDCHLCEVGKETLLRVQAQHPFELREVKMHEGDDTYEQFKERIPIVYINKGFAFQYRVSEEEFMRKLQSATSPPSAEE